MRGKESGEDEGNDDETTKECTRLLEKATKEPEVGLTSWRSPARCLCGHLRPSSCLNPRVENAVKEVDERIDHDVCEPRQQHDALNLGEVAR